MTLNLLRTSRKKPKISAYDAIFGSHGFNWFPLSPPGTKVVVHEKTDNHRSCSPHVTDGCYIGPSMEHYRCVQCFMPTTSSVCNMDTLTLFPTATLFPKTKTEYYLRQSVGDILAIPSKPKTQLPFLTYGGTKTSAVESIAKILQLATPHAPPVTPTPETTPTPELTIPVPKQLPIHVHTISPTMSTVPVKLKRVPIFIPTRPPVQIQRVPLKSPGETNIPSIKAMPPQPVRPSLDIWIHEPRLRQIHAEAVFQLVIQEHLNHLYHPVTGQCETYGKLKLRHPKFWITSMSHELGRLASGVGDIMTSGTDTIFLSTRIKSKQEGRQHIPMKSAITCH